MIFTKNIKHPNEFLLYTGKTQLVDELEAINQSIRLILTTARGELFGDPNFGTELYEFIYDIEGPALQQLIKNEIVRCLNEQESRVFLKEEDIDVIEDGTDVHINIRYHIRYTEYTNDYTFLINRREVA